LPFNLAVGESKTLNVPISIPSLKFGDYTLIYTQSDETRTGQSATKTISNTATISLSLDKAFYRARETANLTVDLTNAGMFNLENASVTVSVPAAGFTDARIVTIGQGQTLPLQYAIPIPSIIAAGQHDVTVQLSLPSGSTLVRISKIIVPESSVAIEYPGLTTIAAGDAINLKIENTGGVDTTSSYGIKLKDITGRIVKEESHTAALTAGEQNNIVFGIPSQIREGYGLLEAEITDNKTGRVSSLIRSVHTAGVMGDLAAHTAKPVFLNSEAVTATSDISIGEYLVEDGELNVSVINNGRGGVSAKSFLPKNAGWNFGYVKDVATSQDGYIYVVDDVFIKKFDSDGNLITQWGGYGSGNGQFYYPNSLAVGADGSVYVLDGWNYRVQKFDGSGNFVAKWGSYGNGNGQFSSPGGIAIAADGSIYIADSYNYRVQKFDGSGNFISKWGSYGSGDTQFYNPNDIAVGPDGNVYVTDSSTNSSYGVKKFDSNGNFISKIGPLGSGDGKLYWPKGISIGSDGVVYVGDYYNRVQKFNGSGTFLGKWGSSGGGDGQLDGIYGIAIGQDNRAYIADYANKRVQAFTTSGVFSDKWEGVGIPSDIAIDMDGAFFVSDEWNSVRKFDSNGNLIKTLGGVSYGSGNGQFYTPTGLTIGYDGSLYVVDRGNLRVQKFDSNGNFITKWGGCCSGDGKFANPNNIAAAPDGSLYVTDSYHRRVQKFDSNGNYILKWGSRGTADGQFESPYGIAVDSDGYVYVVDKYNYNVQKFDGNGNFITKWGSYCNVDANYDKVPDQSCEGKFNSPSDIKISPDNLVYATEEYNHRVQVFDTNGNFMHKFGAYGSADDQFINPKGIAIGSDGKVYIADAGNRKIKKADIIKTGVIWQSTLPINQLADTTEEYTSNTGTLNITGKLYLQSQLKNSLGQIIATSGQPFYIVSGNTVLQFNTDKKVYTPGETVTITGRVENRASVAATNLTLNIRRETSDVLYSATFSVPAGGSYPFTFTTTADTEGKVTLTGSVKQNNTTLVEISDQYEVAAPQVSLSVIGPDVVGRNPFDLNVEIKNTGKVDISGQWSVAGVQGNAIDNQLITIKAGETKALQYSQQIAATTTYTFALTGDVPQTVTKTVAYGEGAAITVSSQQSAVGSLYPEGKIGIPVTITNIGQVDEQLEVNFQLSGQGSVVSGRTKAYYLPIGGSVTDTLYYDLTKGNYQFSAVSIQPVASAQTSFIVLKENDLSMTSSVEAQGSDGLLPVSLSIANNGYNDISGNIKMLLANSTGDAAWSRETEISVNSQSSGNYTINVNASAVAPGIYTLSTILYDTAYQQLTSLNQQVEIKGAAFEITQMPQYQTFTAGQEDAFTFKVRNTGSQEGEMSFNLKVMDVLDQTRTEWLQPGEEKELSFAFLLPEDLEEKDYFAAYSLKAGDSPYSTTASVNRDSPLGLGGVVKFHVAGVNIAVNATLDKQDYNVGDTARLTIAVSTQQSAVSNLFARVNYNGYEEQKTFTLTSASTLTVDVPLSQITGEKLFYGIYHQSGRSIHLNSMYVYKAGDVINITTDKQVYNPGETVIAVISSRGAGASGTMTLTGPGNYSETFAFNGSATKSITLPSIMTAGTYNISATLQIGDSPYSTTSSVNRDSPHASHPIDVNGIQVKVKEATLNKAKYAATDTMSLSLTIESNRDMAARLKTWIVDPSGKYTAAGEQAINLTSTEPLLLTSHSALFTEVMGIHRLVYGIYNNDLLLSSGSEAFDVGDAVLLGMTSSKADYATITEPVNLTLSLYGSTTATVDIYVDGQSVKTETIVLEGFSNKTFILHPSSFIPGSHVIKVVLTAGGLTSSKETSIIYGSDLPDLTAAISGQPSAISKGNIMQITATIVNQGKTASGATDVALYDGDPARGGIPITSLSIPSLESGASHTITYDWDVMGKAGRHTIYAVADASKVVAEFNESNNTANIDVEVPELILNVATTSSAYEANQDVGIAETVTNLTAGTTYSDVLLTTTIKGQGGSILTTLTNTIPALTPGEASYANSWNTASNRPGSYSVMAEVGTGGITAHVQGSTTFKILPTLSTFGDMTLSASEVIQGFPLDINYTLTNNGNVDIANGELKVELKGKMSSISSTLTTATIDYLAVLAAKTGSTAIEKVDAEAGEYTLSLILIAGDKTINIASKDLTVKPPLKVTKSISMIPRVLVWTEKAVVSGRGSGISEPTTNELIAIDALAKLGVYYKVIHSEGEFIESMRSGYYNTYVLLNTNRPTTDGLTSELVERVNGGDTLILTGNSNMDDIKISEVTGTKFSGYMSDGIRVTAIGEPLYEQPVSFTLSGKFQKVNVTSGTAQVIGAVSEYPSVIVNQYGKGKGVLLTFDLGKAADAANDMTTYSALFGRLIGYAAPTEGKLVPESVIPIEITVESLGSAFDLRIMEKADSRFTLLDATGSGTIDRLDNTITWDAHLSENQTLRSTYLAGLPMFRSALSTAAEIYYQSKGGYRLYNTYALSTELSAGTADLQNNILNAISLLTVPKEQQGIKTNVIRDYQALIVRTSVTRKDVEKDIRDLLKIAENLNKLSADISEIRQGLDKLLAILQRRWAVARQG
jgi:sugar lactone lactonase YvrE